MLLAQAEQVIKAADKAIEAGGDNGLIGILLVLVLLCCGIGLMMIARFLAPKISDFVTSTVSLHESLKETSLKQTALLDQHTDHFHEIKADLSQIRQITSGLKCKAQPQPGA